MSDFENLLVGLKDKTRPRIKPGDYVVSRELYGAVEASMATGQPLLLTGEPGTGKTRLASKLAHDLSKSDLAFDPKLEIFYTKTTSTAQDLFYSYDALRHFNDANISKTGGKGKSVDVMPYIRLEALGRAIALTSEQALAGELLSNGGQSQNGRTKKETRSKVVLIDEIDKAPRDFTNDLLNEIENMEFQVKELQRSESICLGEGRRIVVIITSNSEKNLPDAFLRRCAFFHIPFPGPQLLLQIVRMHFPDRPEAAQQAAIDYFGKLRDVATRKKPATAELIAWLHVLEIEEFFTDFKSFSQLTPAQQEALRFSLSVLVKTKDDLKNVQDFLNGA